MSFAHDGWERARAFMISTARPLEQALFAREFEHGADDEVYTHLSAFQNADGGFGNALEPDLRASASSALATSVALQTLRSMNAPTDHPLVQGAMRYLVNTYDRETQRWPIIPPAAQAAPHAPWWEYDAELPQRFGQYLANPRAELLGYCYDYADHMPQPMRDQLTTSVLAHIEQAPDDMDMHDLLCYARLLETRSLPDIVRAPLHEKLTRIVERTVERDPARWAEYGLQPLTIVASPESPFAPMLADAIEANLDYVIAQQQADGSWGPSWSWATFYPDAWPVAERDWKSVLTLGNLQRLRAWGRIAA